MTAATRTPSGWQPRGQHRPDPHPHAARRRRPVRLVLSVLLLVVGLALTLVAQLTAARRPAGAQTDAAAGTAPDAALAAQHADPAMSMPGMAPAASTSPGALVPPESALYTGTAPNDAPLSDTDKDFLVRVRQAGLWEGPAGQQAQTRSQNPAVKEAGQHMMAGHAELDAKVLAIGAQLNVPLPSQPSDAQRGWLAEMAAARTPDQFDQVFANRLRAAHGVVYGFVAQIRAGTRNSIIRAFAQRTMEVVLDHIRMLERTGLVDYGKLTQPKLLPGAANVPTVQTQTGPLTAADHDFLVRVRLAGLWEGPSGRLAQQRTKTASVKTAGQHLIGGHSELDEKVLAMGAQFNIELPTEPNKDQKMWLGEMTAATTQQGFDQVFVDRLRAAHGTVFGYVAAVRASTGNSAIRAFTERTMEVVLDHITVLERTGLVRYDSLPQPVPLPASTTSTSASARKDVPSGAIRYLVGTMLVVAAVVTVLARRDVLPRGR
jgi:predicted outer membrane protein